MQKLLCTRCGPDKKENTHAQQLTLGDGDDASAASDARDAARGTGGRCWPTADGRRGGQQHVREESARAAEEGEG